MTKTFYCDKETHTLIDEARKLNPEFNLSLFVKNSLKNIAGEVKKLDLDFIELNINNLEKEKEKIQEQINYWKNQEIKCYEKIQEEKKKEKEQNEFISEIAKIEEFLNNKTEEQEMEYRNYLGIKWKSYYQYAKFKLKELIV